MNQGPDNPRDVPGCGLLLLPDLGPVQVVAEAGSSSLAGRPGGEVLAVPPPSRTPSFQGPREAILVVPSSTARATLGVANGERLCVSEFHTRIVQADDVGGLVRRLAPLAPDPVPVPVEPVGVGWQHTEAPPGDVPAVQVWRRRGDAHVRVARVARGPGLPARTC
jgi:hypothetical protein